MTGPGEGLFNSTMSKRLALLRAINVSGSGILKMEDLRTLAEGLGFSEVETYLQSGNLVFEAGDRAGPEVERALVEALRVQRGVITDAIVKDGAGLDALISDNPLADLAKETPSKFLVLVLGHPASPAQMEKFAAAVEGEERFAATDAALYAHLPNGIGRSRLAALLSRASGLRGTGRNWNTLLALKALMEA